MGKKQDYKASGKEVSINKKGITKPGDFSLRIIDSAPMSILTIDKNGDITFVNNYFKNLSASKVPLHRNIFKLPFFMQENLSSDYKELLEKGTPVKKENCRTVNSEGQEKYINISAVPLLDKEGNIDGALSIAVDVTDTVVAKLKLDEVNDTLKDKVLRKTQQLLKTNERLEKSLELKSQFISDASHELRTPLAIAKLNLEFFRGQFPKWDGASTDVLVAIDNEINKVSDILSDISFFAAIDKGTVAKMSMEQIDLNKFIENLVERIKSLTEKKNIKIVFKKNNSNLTVKGDKIKLERLFINIIGNAIKYGKEAGRVKIWSELDKKNNLVKVSIEDNGVGISKKDLTKIFDRFYRTDLPRNDGEGGFGLGLAICKWIVQQHKGSIEAKSDVGKGSVFTVSLPSN